MKTVTFLLPLDDIYTNRPGRSRPLEDPSDPDPRDPDPRDPDPRDPDPRATELDPLTETDY